MNFENIRWECQEQQWQYSYDVVNKILEECPNGSILDVGGGDGLFLSRHLNRGKNRILNVDASNVAVQKSLERGVPSQVCNIEKDTLTITEKFNFATMFDVLEHTLTPRFMLERVREVADKIVIVTPNFANIMFRLQLLFGKIPSENTEKKGHCFFFTKNKLEEVLRESGLKIVQKEYYFIGQNLPIIGFMLKLLGKFRPSLFATQFIYECKQNNMSYHEPTIDMLDARC